MKYSLIISAFFVTGLAFGAELYPLHDAARRGDLQAVKDLVEKYRVDVDMPTADGGVCPLHCAAEYGHAAIVRYLLSKGACAAVVTRALIRPVHLAAKNGHVDILRSFIQYPDKMDVFQPPTIRANVQDIRGYTPMHYAVENGDILAVQYLKEWGARVDIADKNGMTPILLAKAKQYDHIVHYLTLRAKM
jgi:ankyrin repeat protein